jgi:hypothetical protein
MLILACSSESLTTSSSSRPADDLANEVVDVGTRVDPRAVNAHVYGSFRVDGGGGTPGVITGGPANFPGSPSSGPGTCVDGQWYNSQGKATSGSLVRPHPHCIRPAAAMEVVLEPLSACFSGFPGNTIPCPAVVADKNYTSLTAFLGGGTSSFAVQGFEPRIPGTVMPKSDGAGSVTAYAIDATTLGTTNRRVGTLTFDLAQYNSTTENYLPADADGNPTCTVDPAQASPCLNKVISAVYNPLPAPDGLGPTDFTVAGYLWLRQALGPYNYSDMGS